jgi:hypothetical protein
MKVQRIEIVQARTKGITGYVNVGRGTIFGNFYEIGVHCLHPTGNYSKTIESLAESVAWFQEFWNRPTGAYNARQAAIAFLDRETPDGTLTIACPCNGTFKGQPCHATVIKEFLDAELARRNGAPS